MLLRGVVGDGFEVLDDELLEDMGGGRLGRGGCGRTSEDKCAVRRVCILPCMTDES